MGLGEGESIQRATVEATQQNGVGEGRGSKVTETKARHWVQGQGLHGRSQGAGPQGAAPRTVALRAE